MENLEKETPTYERHDVEETPFSIIVEQPSGKCKIAIGMNLMTKEEFEGETEAKEYIYTQPWELILNTMALMIKNIVEETINNINQKPNENA